MSKKKSNRKKGINSNNAAVLLLQRLALDPLFKAVSKLANVIEFIDLRQPLCLKMCEKKNT